MQKITTTVYFTEDFKAKFFLVYETIVVGSHILVCIFDPGIWITHALLWLR